MLLNFFSFAALTLIAVKASSPAPKIEMAPLINLPYSSVSGSYILKFKKGVRASEHSTWVQDIHLSDIAENGPWHDKEDHGVRHIYDAGGFQGLAGRFRPNIVDRIRMNPKVDYIEVDQVMHISDYQDFAPWNLKRISARSWPDNPNPIPHIGDLYKYNSSCGKDVTVYVVDTGINSKHEEFEGRASWGYTSYSPPLTLEALCELTPICSHLGLGSLHGLRLIPYSPTFLAIVNFLGQIIFHLPVFQPIFSLQPICTLLPIRLGATEDDNGHGTHVAGTIAGRNYGVAKKAKIVGVKVANQCGGAYTSAIIDGIAWVIKNHDQKNTAVINLSISGGQSDMINQIIDEAVDNGIFVSVAAGNENADACGFSPASAMKAMCVGATSITDHRKPFSNYGDCVDIFAPGENIRSAWIGNDTAYYTMSGTSTAAPHVAGLAACYMGANPNMKPLDIRSKMQADAVPVVKNANSSINLLINNKFRE